MWQLNHLRSPFVPLTKGSHFHQFLSHPKRTKRFRNTQKDEKLDSGTVPRLNTSRFFLSQFEITDSTHLTVTASLLISGLEHDISFSIYWEDVIIPIDELIFFRGVFPQNHQPDNMINIHHYYHY